MSTLTINKAIDTQNSKVVLSKSIPPEVAARMKRNEAKIKPMIVKAKLGMQILADPPDDAYLASKNRQQIVKLIAYMYHYQLFSSMNQTLSKHLPAKHVARPAVARAVNFRNELVYGGTFEEVVERMLQAAGFNNKMLAITLIMTRVRNEWQDAKLLHTSITDSVKHGPKQNILVTAFSSKPALSNNPDVFHLPPTDLD